MCSLRVYSNSQAAIYDRERPFYEGISEIVEVIIVTHSKKQRDDFEIFKCFYVGACRSN